MELTSSPATASLAAAPTMPLLAGGTHAHVHSIHSALVSLAALGIGSHRITLRRAGRDAHPSGTVVRQEPPPGSLLTPDTLIRLEVSGLGFTQALPVGMWDSGGEAAAGTREILDAFDDPLEKLKHWFHEGAPLFRLSPEDFEACARWLALFGIEASTWPRALWYRLATLAAHLPQLSCSQAGCATVLNTMLFLPVRHFRYRRALSALPETALSHLGRQSSRLGIDLVLGDTLEDLATLEIELGPVALNVYEYFAETEAGAELLRRVLHLVMPLSPAFDLRWHVEDPAKPPRLGVAAANSRLGVNTHMGQPSRSLQ